MPLSLKRYPMPVQPAAERIKNFSEVAQGYDEETAVAEAGRCLNCKNPQCMKGCPIHNHIPAFIKKIKERDFAGADKEIRQVSNFPEICSRVCPQVNQCEKNCVLSHRGDAVAIGALERFAADYSSRKLSCIKPVKFAADAQKVAIIGSGPAGLSAANELINKGYRVTVFDALDRVGGILSYGIPEFRLPKKQIVYPLIERLERRGVKFVTNTKIDENFNIDRLMSNEWGFAAIFLAAGTGIARKLNIPGEALNGIYSANDFLRSCNIAMEKNIDAAAYESFVGKKIAVIGGGNVAMDAARTALRFGATDVYIIYRRDENELPARRDEISHAKAEGVKFLLQHNPIEIEGNENGWITAIRCARTAAGKPAADGRVNFYNLPEEVVIPVDTVITAIGQLGNQTIQEAAKIDTTQKGTIAIDDETGKTSRNGVFAGGDIVTGAATVIKAMKAGREIAASIDEYLKSIKR